MCFQWISVIRKSNPTPVISIRTAGQLVILAFRFRTSSGEAKVLVATSSKLIGNRPMIKHRTKIRRLNLVIPAAMKTSSEGTGSSEKVKMSGIKRRRLVFRISPSACMWSFLLGDNSLEKKAEDR